MTEPITRRQFLANSAAFAGAVAVFDPGWLFGGATGAEALAARPGGIPDRGGRPAAGGVAAQVEYGEGFVRWTRLGEDYVLELGPGELVMNAPTLSEKARRIPIEEFELGRGHHDVGRFFGPEALAQVRTEVAYRAVMEFPT